MTFKTFEQSLIDLRLYVDLNTAYASRVPIERKVLTLPISGDSDRCGHFPAFSDRRSLNVSSSQAMADGTSERSEREVWMLDTFGNVHSLVNACKQLGFKVNRITDPKQLQIAEVHSLPFLTKSRKSCSAE